MPRKRQRCLKIKDVRFGIEIEVEFPEVKDSYELIDKHRLIRGWTIQHDGSLDNGAEYKPKDRNKLHYNEDCIDQIKEIIGLIRAHKGTIRPTCGLHIHVDMSKFTHREVVNIVKAFIDKQYYIYKQFNIIKSRMSSTAQKIPHSVKHLISERIVENLSKDKEVDYGEKNEYFTDRYYGLNLQSLSLHNTIEFRLFNGTIQPGRIKKYIKWCLEFCLENRKG
jgi:hypothetical protein